MTDRVYRRYAALVLAAATLSACTHDWQYAQPAALAPETAATITGSKISNPGALSDDPRAYLVAIDGKLTDDGPRGWDDRVLASSGSHSIGFGVSLGIGHIFGFGEATVELKGGQTYTIHSTIPIQIARDEFHADGWIEDDNGKAVTDRVPVVLHVAHGGEVIPIIIPK